MIFAELLNVMTSIHSRPQAGPRGRLTSALTQVAPEAFRELSPERGVTDARRRPAPTSVVETMLLGLALEGTERVLCVGHAVGYPVALLSHLAEEVHAIEIESALVEPERILLAQLGRTNVTLVHDDAVRGKHLAAPFDAILVTSAAPELPPALIEQLAIGGRIVIALGDEQGQLIELLEKRVDTLVSRTLGACALPVFPSMLRTPSTFPWGAHHDHPAPRG